MAEWLHLQKPSGGCYNIRIERRLTLKIGGQKGKKKSRLRSTLGSRLERIDLQEISLFNDYKGRKLARLWLWDDLLAGESMKSLAVYSLILKIPLA